MALILDARIDPRLKLDLAPQLNGSVETEDPRGGMTEVFADGRDKVDSDQLGRTTTSPSEPTTYS